MEEEKIDLKEEFSKLNENSTLREFQEYTRKMIKAKVITLKTHAFLIIFTFYHY